METAQRSEDAGGQKMWKKRKREKVKIEEKGMRNEHGALRDGNEGKSRNQIDGNIFIKESKRKTVALPSSMQSAV